MTEPRSPQGRGRALYVLVFLATFVAFAWFHPGGGWNQNARFALVRAIVEEGRVSVDSFLVYRAAGAADPNRLVRSPLRDGEVHLAEGPVALYWNGIDGRPVPLTRRVSGHIARTSDDGSSIDVGMVGGPAFRIELPPGIVAMRDGGVVPVEGLRSGDEVQVTLRSPDGRHAVASAVNAGPADFPAPVRWAEPASLAVTGDLSFFAGHFHPAKAPGGSFLAVPAYALVRAAERIGGVDPDGVRALTLGAWLTSLLSVGLLAALTAVLVLRLALRLSGGQAISSLLAALTLSLGTPFLPYSTMLYEHGPVAFLLVAAVSLLEAAREVPTLDGERIGRGRARIAIVLAGAAAGLAITANYAMLAPATILCAYVLLTGRRDGGWALFLAGMVPPLLLLAAYHAAAFGTPLTTNYAFEDPQFLERGDAVLGVFRLPHPEVLLLALVSPFRGLLLAAPAVLLGILGLVFSFRSGRMRAEWGLSTTLSVFFLVLLTTFNGWHGGWAASPRYLVPALPLVMVAAVLAFSALPRLSAAIAAVSVCLSILVTAVDPQAPVGLTPFAEVPGLAVWLQSPLIHYDWPIFASGLPKPILAAQREQVLTANDVFLSSLGAPASVREGSADELARRIDDAIRDGRPAPLVLGVGPDGTTRLSPSPLSAVRGPVSANPTGIYEGEMFQVFPAGSAQVQGNSFNLGELLLPRSRLSLLPLLILEAILGTLAFQAARRLDGARSEHPG